MEKSIKYTLQHFSICISPKYNTTQVRKWQNLNFQVNNSCPICEQNPWFRIFRLSCHLYFTHRVESAMGWVGSKINRAPYISSLTRCSLRRSGFTLTFEGEVNKHQGVELRLSRSINQETKWDALLPQGFRTKELPPQRLSLSSHLCPSSSGSRQQWQHQLPKSRFEAVTRAYALIYVIRERRLQSWDLISWAVGHFVLLF